MTKALTKRFQSHLPTVIAADQTCSIPERSINDNLLLVRDVILHSQECGSPLGLLSLDQEKAFDRVSHGFLQRVLKKINFPQHLINWTNLCYQNNKPDRKASFFERHYATPILRTLGMGTIDHTVPYSWCCGMLRSLGIAQYQPRTPAYITSTTNSTGTADGAGCSQASSINDLRVRTPLWAGSLPNCFSFPTTGPAPPQHPEEAWRRDPH
ncbi:hypothetical protein DPEC_G00179130 [Dallia pectoralis]|uniref:Uncharacterized protein n=1 Tax=Dallia pectoralis TaxID=75939 RepID=A0ACC2GFM2_DALPE|nr:hypothetical protein DPEC_G00179130 [Dallia pectoralis]